MYPEFRTRRWIRSLALLFAVGSGLALAQLPDEDVLAANAALLQEQQAYHVGSLAYIWGYPMVDMSRQMHNETRRVATEQQTFAPVNHFYRFEYLVTPETMGNLRAANNDTLYFGGWFDLSAEPVVVRAPDTDGRYYTMAVTDFYSEVQHVGRRTTGTAQKDFALVGPRFEGELPEALHPVHVPTEQAWILGRLLVDDEADLDVALPLLRAFKAAPLSAWKRGDWPEAPRAIRAEPLQPMTDLGFFEVLNRWLRANPLPQQDATLLAWFDEVGFGPASEFDAASAPAPLRRGLERAIADGQALLRASTRQPLPDVRNGWIFPLGLGRYGSDYMMRAAVVYGGYANLPEESTYVARVVDADGALMSGQHRYHLHFGAGQLPPAAAFWSISAYDLQSMNLIENPIRRYSLGNRTAGLQFNDDGSLDVYIQRDEPEQGPANWLPVGDGPFSLVVRIYEPEDSVFDGSYRPPQLQRLP